MTAYRPKKERHIQEGNVAVTVVLYVLAVLAALICIYPMYYVLCMSLSSPAAVSGFKVYGYPIGLQFNAYNVIVRKSAMWQAYGMTIFYVVVSTAITLLTCILAAYPLTSPNLIGKKYLTIFLLVPMYFSGGLIPTFMIMKTFGLYNNVWAMIVPNAFSIWYIILTRTYFHSIPETMREAAKIDGASSYQILFHIYLPLAKPILAVIAIYTIVKVWNGWFTAQVYLRDLDLQPLQLYLRRVLVSVTQKLTQPSTKEEMEMIAKTRLANLSLQYAMIIFTTLPVIFTYPFFQKYFVKGVMVGSLKG
jgi:ABC-type sugar transport system, permease component